MVLGKIVGDGEMDRGSVGVGLKFLNLNFTVFGILTTAATAGDRVARVFEGR